MRSTLHRCFRVLLTAAVLPCLTMMATWLVCPTNAWAQSHSHVRGGWLVGLGLGGGSAGISESDEREGGFAGSFHVGYGFSRQIALELQSSLWMKEEGGATLTFDTVGFGVSVYPGESGFFLRGGVGLGTAEVDFGGSTVSEEGFGILFATGYEFRVLRSFAFGPQLDFGYGSVDSFDFNYVNGSLQGTWYFIPRSE